MYYDYTVFQRNCLVQTILFIVIWPSRLLLRINKSISLLTYLLVLLVCCTSYVILIYYPLIPYWLLFLFSSLEKCSCASQGISMILPIKLYLLTYLDRVLKTFFNFVLSNAEHYNNKNIVMYINRVGGFLNHLIYRDYSWHNLSNYFWFTKCNKADTKLTIKFLKINEKNFSLNWSLNFLKDSVWHSHWYERLLETPSICL